MDLKKCPYCGAEVAAEDHFCLECGESLTSVPAPASAPVPEVRQDFSVSQPVASGDAEKLQAQLNWANTKLANAEMEQAEIGRRWKKRFVITTVLLSLCTIVFLVLMLYFNTEYRDSERAYYYTRRQYYDLQSDYEDLEEAYSTVEGYRDLIEYNNFDRLYQVEFTDFFNAGGKGEKINDDLTAGTMDRLRFDILITGPEDTALWLDPLDVKLTLDGEQIDGWTVEPYDSEVWGMWTGADTIKEAGTYVVECIHNGIVVARQEIVIQ